MSVERTLLDKIRDYTGIDYDRITHAFAPTFTSWVAGWPVIAVFPLSIGAGSVDPLIASLLRRDLSFAGPISVLGLEDTPPETYHGLLDWSRESAAPLAWDVAGVGCELQAGRLVFRGFITRINRLDGAEELRVEGPLEQLGELTVQLAARFAGALGLTPDERARELWREEQPKSWQALQGCARAWEENDVAWLMEGLERGEVHADALVTADSDAGEPDLVRRAVALACARDRSNPQLCFKRFADLWKGEGRDTAAARILVQGLKAAPGHGKSQMCLAHLIERLPSNGKRILAHAEAGYRLLPGNSFALSNFMNYLNMYAPDDARRGPLMEEMLRTDPYHPDVLKQAMDLYIELGQPRRALELALRLKELCSEPIHPRTLYCLRQNPRVAAELSDGTYKPLDDALRCIAICEKAVRKAEAS